VRCHLDRLNVLMDKTWRLVRRLGCIIGNSEWAEMTWNVGLKWIRSGDDHTDEGDWERKRDTWQEVSG
jgi:hypothetical protein